MRLTIITKNYKEVPDSPSQSMEGAGVKQNGWVGGNAWFGCVMTCVEVWKRFQVHLTFIVKGNINFFPMRSALHAILRA
jgi:hypothetical protein